VECWPRHADPTAPGAKQYGGWPKTINKLDNYARKAVAYLPTITVTGMESPVVQIVDESNGATVYTVRIVGTEFRPKVFKNGRYTVRVGEQPDGMKSFAGVKALPADEAATLEVSF
jgi:hypothetical protein